jgi:hypothetical protein
MEETHGARILRQIKEICEIAGIKTEEYARVTKKRLDVVSLSRELAREKSMLGERVTELAQQPEPGEILEDATVQAVLDRIRNLEGGLRDCEEEIATLREAAGARASDVRRRYHEDEEPSGETLDPDREAVEPESGGSEETPAEGEKAPARPSRRRKRGSDPGPPAGEPESEKPANSS